MAQETTQASEVVPASLADAIHQAEQNLVQLHSLLPEAAELETIAAQYPDLSAQVCILGGAGSLHAVIYLSPRGRLDHAVAPILRDLHAHGWHREADPELNDAGEVMRWYLFKPNRLSLTVYANISHGCTCRRVQVATKTVPVYEIHCDDGAEELS